MPPSSTLTDRRRLAELHELGILDTPPEVDYDDLAALAAAVCDSPVAAVNFVDAERHFTKAVVGLPEALGGSVPNHLSFCASTVCSPEGVLVVSDTHADPRWSAHPLVTDGPRVGFYAGVSIMSGGEPVGVICAFGREPRDVSDKQRAALATLARQASAQLLLRHRDAELRELAVTDPLTGLDNRTGLFDRLETALADRERAGDHVGVIFCDVDDFKRVNDRYGHEAGDRLLRDVADHLRAAARATDTVARIAGDEFVVVCPGLTGADAMDEIARRLRATAGRRLLPGGGQPPQLSVGAVLAGRDESPAAVLRRADAAMYAVKAAVRVVPARREDGSSPAPARLRRVA